MIKPIKIEDIPYRNGPMYNRSIIADIEEFLRMEDEAVDVSWAGHYKTASSANAAYSAAIKRMKVGMRSVKRGDRVFLVKTKE